MLFVCVLSVSVFVSIFVRCFISAFNMLLHLKLKFDTIPSYPSYSNTHISIAQHPLSISDEFEQTHLNYVNQLLVMLIFNSASNSASNSSCNSSCNTSRTSFKDTLPTFFMPFLLYDTLFKLSGLLSIICKCNE